MSLVSFVPSHQVGHRAIQLCVLSCALAIAANLAQYNSIHLLRPDIYAALGQVKTSALVVLGSLPSHRWATIEQLIGTGLASLVVG